MPTTKAQGQSSPSTGLLLSETVATHAASKLRLKQVLGRYSEYFVFLSCSSEDRGGG